MANIIIPFDFQEHILKKGWILQRSADQPAVAREQSLKENLLALDDDPVSLTILEAKLQSRYRVHKAATIAQAIAIARKTPIQHFISDYHLNPTATGTMAMIALKGLPEFNPRRAILITAQPSMKMEREILEVGFERLFTKPLNNTFWDYFNSR